MDDSIYVRRRDAAEDLVGPLTPADFLNQVDAKAFQFGDHAWRTGLPDWTLVGALAMQLRARRAPGPSRHVEPPAFRGPAPIADAARQDASVRQFLRQMDAVRILAGTPAEAVELATPLVVMLASNPSLPGGRLGRKLASEMTQLLAARLRHEQAGLLAQHPARLLRLVTEKGWADGEWTEECLALIAHEELKRQAVLVGADLLVEYSFEIRLVQGVDAAGKAGPPAPVVMARAIAALTAAAVEARKAQRPAPVESAPVVAGGAPDTQVMLELAQERAALEAMRRQLDEREAYLVTAEARVIGKIEEQQLREAELEQREDVLRRREVLAGFAPPEESVPMEKA